MELLEAIDESVDATRATSSTSNVVNQRSHPQEAIIAASSDVDPPPQPNKKATSFPLQIEGRGRKFLYSMCSRTVLTLSTLNVPTKILPCMGWKQFYEKNVIISFQPKMEILSKHVAQRLKKEKKKKNETWSKEQPGNSSLLCILRKAHTFQVKGSERAHKEEFLK